MRQADDGELAPCNQLCRRVHGHDRAGELKDAIQGKTATVVEHLGRITGYATSIGFFAHAIGETNEDLMALVSAAANITGPGIPQPCAVFMVPRKPLELGLSDDAYEHWTLQRTGGGVSAFGSVLRHSVVRRTRALPPCISLCGTLANRRPALSFVCLVM